jgi:prepilin-type N-terminal cleavage/methylation domain-containing protein
MKSSTAAGHQAIAIKTRKTSRGFSLIELLAAMVIMGLLLGAETLDELSSPANDGLITFDRLGFTADVKPLWRAMWMTRRDGHVELLLTLLAKYVPPAIVMLMALSKMQRART